MNKILIVGHPQSGYREVERLLSACGMATAQPSRREGFLPEQISSTLCKVHSAPALNQVDTDEQIKQIEAGAVWHGMALDLMLGNLDQPIWGWADPQAIYLLNYWRDLDPNITFILVYDRPHSVLTEAPAEDSASLSDQELSQRTNQWAAYNAALLHFYHRNAHRCLLVHSQQVRESASSYLQQVRTRINAPWPESMLQLAASPPPREPQAQLGAQLADSADTRFTEVVADGFDDRVAHLHFRGTTAIGTVSVEDAEQQPVEQTRSEDHTTLAIFIADALLRQQPASQQLYEELQAAANLPFANGVDTVLHAQSALQAWRSLNIERAHLQQQHLLLGQLHHSKAQTQAALAQASQERDHVRDEHARATQRIDALQHQLAQKGALDQENELLRLQLKQETEAPKVDPALVEENELLLTQLHMVQEELERYFLQGQEQAKRVQALQEREDQLQAELATAKSIPQAQTLSAEAAQMIAQLLQAQEAEERRFHNNQDRVPGKRNRHAHTADADHPDAADRVRQHLSYRLGQTMIQRSRSLGGWIGMPFSLARTARDYRRDQAKNATTPQHTFNSPHDKKRAEEIKQHLSYRLGSTLIAHGRSPIGWIKLPFALRREVKAFRQRKKA